MTVPRIVQALATRIGIPGVEPRNTLVDWCEMPNAQWRVTPEDAEYSNSCGPWGGELCVPGFANNSSIVFSNQENFIPFHTWDLTGKAISFRVKQPSGYGGFSFKQILMNFDFGNGLGFGNYGVEISTWADPDENTGLWGFAIYGDEPSVFSDSEVIAPPWYRVIFHPDGQTISCQISSDCGIWETILTSSINPPGGFRKGFGQIIVFNAGFAGAPDPICMSQIYVEDFDLCMIEEET
jgi:hypothetical protein